MANKEIGDLTTVGTLDGTEYFILTDSDGNSRKVTLAGLKTYVNTDPTVVPSSEPWRGALVDRSSNLTGVTTGSIITWNRMIEDTDGFWSVGAPTRLTIPSGVTRARLFWGLHTEGLSTAGSVSGIVLKNGANASYNGQNTSRQGATGSSVNNVCGFTTAIAVTAGDYFELQFDFVMTGQDAVITSSRTFFEIEVVEASL